MWTQPLHHFLRIKLPSHFNLAEWGGARGEKGRIYQPHPLSDLIVGPQPLLHFLRFTITFPPWGGGGARDEKTKSTSHTRCLPSFKGHNRYSTSFDVPSHTNGKTVWTFASEQTCFGYWCQWCWWSIRIRQERGDDDDETMMMMMVMMRRCWWWWWWWWWWWFQGGSKRCKSGLNDASLFDTLCQVRAI